MNLNPLPLYLPCDYTKILNEILYASNAWLLCFAVKIHGNNDHTAMSTNSFFKRLIESFCMIPKGITYKFLSEIISHIFYCTKRANNI